MNSKSAASEHLLDYVTGVFYFDGAIACPGMCMSQVLSHFAQLFPKFRAKVFASSPASSPSTSPPRSPAESRALPLEDPSLQRWLSALSPMHAISAIVRRPATSGEVFDHHLVVTIEQAETLADRAQFTGTRTDTTISFTLRADLVRSLAFASDDAEARVSQWFGELVRVLTSNDPCYFGFVHTMDACETSSGTLHNSLKIGGVPWGELMTDRVWWAHRERRIDCVRGVYWGNYYGPALCRLLSKSPNLTEWIEQKLHQPEWRSPYHPLFEKHANGGLFFGLCDTPVRFASETCGGQYAINSKVGPIATEIWMKLSERGLTP